MRLTPSWLRPSSNTPPDECSEGSEPPPGPDIPIYHNLQGPHAVGATEVDAFVPDDDDELRVVLEDVQLPATVDELTDQLIAPAQPPLDTWAGVHERLHQERLPALEAAGEIEFDETQGVVERSMTDRNEGPALSPAVFGTVSLVVLFALLTLISVSLMTALTVTVVTTTIVWFVPSVV
ncbi:hypothetical protein G6M89_15820 [Natronolimnobius sp. AArcel1]|uniref:hypothetical protein n=1 Tax=Natronolimnobius sp. AArcel1 TaxID=1679093 RepID=UPI0013E9F693|nr:hypothetical protein [Natronolimnobius sp. AArcel1]NGM70450.1 hypothetical protein [Natronolimnobius sp. AArcel1]